MRATRLPEILRTDLQEVSLDVKAQGFDIPIAEFLNGAIGPPQAEAAVDGLKTLEALTDAEKLTPLARLLDFL
jgi:ATP-dependent RNA helicase DHX36